MKFVSAVFSVVAIGLATFNLAACSTELEEEWEQEIRSVFEQVRAGRVKEVEARSSEELRGPQLVTTLERLKRDVIPSDMPESVRPLGWMSLVNAERRQITARHEYKYADRILIATTTIARGKDASYEIRGFFVQAFDIATVQKNEFKLRGTPIKQLTFFGGLLATVALMVITALWVLFTKNFKRKWLWAIVSLLGGPIILMNWTTGAVMLQFGFGILNAGVASGGSLADPWIARFQLPIGAVVALVMLLRHRQNVVSQKKAEA